jgi:hypothetical protein
MKSRGLKKNFPNADHPKTVYALRHFSFSTYIIVKSLFMIGLSSKKALG